MSFLNFAATAQAKVIETGELISGGGATLGKNYDLIYMQLGLFKNGAHAGTEKLRVKLFSDAALTKVYAISAWAALADIPGITASSWLGWLRFDFAGEPLNGALSYWVGVETSGYGRNGNAFYLALLRDWGINLSGNPRALAMAFYGERWVS